VMAADAEQELIAANQPHSGVLRIDTSTHHDIPRFDPHRKVSYRAEPPKAAWPAPQAAGMGPHHPVGLLFRGTSRDSKSSFIR
jgi:hypothetical protein